jgi:hypothetical protein
MRYFRKPTRIILCILLAMLFVGCAKESPAQTGKSVTIEVRDLEGAQLALIETVTVAENLSELLMEQELMDYDDTGLGRFITGLAGVIADPSTEYWAIYVNEEYGLYGADNQKVSDGDLFLFLLEEY